MRERQLTMRMWKIGIACLLLATSAFGAVGLSVTPAVTVGPLPALAPVSWTFSVSGLAGLGGMPLVSYTIKTTSVDAANWKFSSRADLTGGMISDPTYAAPTNKLATQITDLGYSSAAPDALNVTMDGPLMRYTFTQVTQKTVAQSITFVGSTTLWDNTGGPLGDGYDEFGFPILIDGPVFQPATVSITPEPISMLLLAAGTAFFARRRQA